MNLSPLPIQKFFDSNGAPLVGGKLFTYVSGTSTKQATYTSSTGLSSNTNPVILDYRGECRLWIDPELSYTFVLAPATDTDPPGAPIWTVNDITAAPANSDNAAVDTGSVNNVSLSIPSISSPVAFTRVVFQANHTNTGPMTLQINGGTAKNLRYQNTAAFAGGEILSGGIYEAVFDGTQWQLQGPAVAWWQTAAETTASVTPTNYAKFPSPWKDISRFVSDNTGATDVTTQFNNALLAEKNVIIPEGEYLVSGSLLFRDNMRIEGAGYLNTTIKGAMASKSFFRSSYGESPSLGERPTGVTLANFSIQPDSIAAGSIGVNFRNSQYMTMFDVLIKNTESGFVTDQIAQYNNYIGVKVQVATTGAYLESSGGGNKLIGCDIAGNICALDLHSGAYDVLGGTFEALQTSTTYCIHAGRSGGAAVSFTITGAYIEGTDASIIPFQAEDSVSGSRFSADLHGTLGSIVNNATLGELSYDVRGYSSPFTRTQLMQFAATLAGSIQSNLRSNGSGTVEARNAANSDYADFFAKNLFAMGAAAGITGTISLGNGTQSTVGAAGGASALPATPAGYWRIFVGTTERVVPYYVIS